MSGIQSKCTRHTRKQKNTAHNEDKNQSIKTVHKMTQIIERVNKEIKTATGKCSLTCSLPICEVINIFSYFNLLDMDFYVHAKQKSRFTFFFNRYPISQESLIDKEHFPLIMQVSSMSQITYLYMKNNIIRQS